MPRWRQRQRKTLSGPQLQLLVGGNVFLREPGQTIDDAVIRHFGSFENAEAMYLAHEAEILAADPSPGTRPVGWWWFRCPRPWPGENEWWSPPPAGLKILKPPKTTARPVPLNQTLILDRMGLLSDFEKAAMERLRDDAS